MGRLLTVGHGTLDRHGLAALLTDAGADLLVDVRRFPASRHDPDVSTVAMVEWLPEAGIDHRWDERLGGRRRVPEGEKDADCCSAGSTSPTSPTRERRPRTSRPPGRGSSTGC